MSRGLGSLQRLILTELEARKGTSTLESIRWALATDDRAGSDLPKSFGSGIERAVRGLVDRGLVITKKRALATVEEWLTHYPGKTYSCAIRQVRIDLLPVLVEWMRVERDSAPLYSAEENERFYTRDEGGSLANRLRRRDRGRQFVDEWTRLEPQLCAHFATVNSEALFYLLARGKYLFTGAPIQTPFSFSQMVARCASESALPAELIRSLKSLADRFLPPSQAAALEFKSYVYRFITSVLHGHPDLKPEALDALFKARPDYLKALPGFSPPKERSSSRGLWMPEYRWKGSLEKSCPLRRLIDQTTFQRFHFLRLSSSAPHGT